MRVVILLIAVICSVLSGCAGTKERNQLDKAVAEIVKTGDFLAQEGVIDQVKVDKTKLDISKAYEELARIEAQYEQMKAAYDAAKAAP